MIIYGKKYYPHGNSPRVSQSLSSFLPDSLPDPNIFY